jgi:hypothetical protein
VSQAAVIVEAIADLVQAIDGLIRTDTFKELVNLVEQLGLAKTVVPILNVICDALSSATRWVGTLGRIAALPGLTEPLILSFRDIAVLTDMTPPGKKEELVDMGWGDLIAVSDATNVVISLFTKLWNVSRALTGKELLGERLKELGGRMDELFKTFDEHRKQLSAPAVAAPLPDGAAR